MKKLFLHGITGIIISVVFASCSSNISLTKRHYTKGWCVEHSKDRQSATAFDKKGKTTENETKKHLASEQNNTEPTILTYTDPTKKIVTAKTINGSFNKKTPHNSISRQRSKPAIKNNFRISEEPGSQIKNTWRTIKDDTKAPGARDGLSLFWIVILVVLILWALGLFSGGFGLGGLINLLLVVALILLVLWLLKII